MTQAETEHSRNGALRLVLAFVGGALAGGAAAMLWTPRSGAEMRRRIGGAMDGTKRFAARMPKAIGKASSAAQVAFSAALKGGVGDDAIVPAPPKTTAHHPA